MLFPKLKWKKKSQPKKSTSGQRLWRLKCLRLWSKCIQARAHGVCERCPKPSRHSHHIIVRGTSPGPAWFDLDNGVALCVDCHNNHAHSIDFDKQKVFNDWVREHLKRKGVDYETLRIKAKARGKMGLADYQFMAHELSMALQAFSC